MKYRIQKWLLVIAAAFASLFTIAGFTGCGSSGSTYSLLSGTQGFKQQSTNGQIDILWVVDNSPSMSPLQANMTSNFQNFMTDFEGKNFDFHIAVTSTDSYLSGQFFDNTPSRAEFSDGISPNLSGVFDIFSTTPNLLNTFVMNASLGSGGSADERAFSSMTDALNSGLNTGFRRDGAFLAVIILSDEDDFSDPTRPELSWTMQGGIPDHDYADPNLDPVADYVTYLSTLTSSTATQVHFSVSAIAVLDQTCQQQHVINSPSAIIGQRYIAMANQTGGVLGSVCDASYASALTAIQNSIIELSTQFYLTGDPVVNSIVVRVNGAVVPADPTNGWTYNSTANSVVFHGTAVPAANSVISVSFDPAQITF